MLGAPSRYGGFYSTCFELNKTKLGGREVWKHVNDDVRNI